MGSIERRRRVVTLHQGHYEAELADLLDKMMAAQRAEAAEESEADKAPGAPLRAGQRAARRAPKQSIEYARQYDSLVTEAEATAEKVTVWAIGHDEWSQLADDHPPRPDIPGHDINGTVVGAQSFPDDKMRGVNTKSFPPLLLCAALVEPHAADDLDDRIAKGRQILADLDLSRIHYVKLETAAWNVNVGDDSLPKSSMVSLLTEATASDSKQPHDSE